MCYESITGGPALRSGDVGGGAGHGDADTDDSSSDWDSSDGGDDDVYVPIPLISALVHDLAVACADPSVAARCPLPHAAAEKGHTVWGAALDQLPRALRVRVEFLLVYESAVSA